MDSQIFTKTGFKSKKSFAFHLKLVDAFMVMASFLVFVSFVIDFWPNPLAKVPKNKS